MALPRFVRAVRMRDGSIRYRSVVSVGAGRRRYGPLFDEPAKAAADAARFRAREGRLGASLTLAEGYHLLRGQMVREGRSEGTLAFYGEAFHRLTLRLDPSLEVAAITADDARAHAEARAAAGIAAGTIWGGELLVLRRIVRVAIDRGILRDDPLTGLKAPRWRQGRYNVTTAGRVADVIKRMRAETRPRRMRKLPRDIAVLELLLGTGIRRSELARLRTADIDLDRRALRVTGKTANREIPLDGMGLRAAKAILKHTVGDGRIFLTAGAIDSLFDRVTARYGEGLVLTPHVLRHTFATECVRRGVQPFVLATILGHRSIQQTMRYYHAGGEEIRAALRGIGQ